MAAAPVEAPDAMKSAPTKGSVAAQIGRAVTFKSTPVYPATKKPAVEPTTAYHFRGMRLYAFANGANCSFFSDTRLSRKERNAIAPKRRSAQEPTESGDWKLRKGKPPFARKKRYQNRPGRPRSAIRSGGVSRISGNAI